MPIYQTGGYQVKVEAVDKVKQAIKDFVAYVEANEPGNICTSPGSRKMIQPIFCISSSSRTLPHTLVTANQMPLSASRLFTLPRL
jgi:hypothetical protein